MMKIIDSTSILFCVDSDFDIKSEYYDCVVRYLFNRKFEISLRILIIICWYVILIGPAINSYLK